MWERSRWLFIPDVNVNPLLLHARRGGQCSKLLHILHPSTHLLGFLSTEEETHTCVHLCTHTQNVHPNIRTLTHIHMYTQTCTHTQSDAHHLHTQTHTQTRICLYSDTETHTYTNAQTHAGTHTRVTQLCTLTAGPLPPQHNEPGRLFLCLRLIKCPIIPGSGGHDGIGGARWLLPF